MTWISLRTAAHFPLLAATMVALAVSPAVSVGQPPERPSPPRPNPAAEEEPRPAPAQEQGLSQDILNAKDDFRPITEADAQAAKQKLRAALASLQSLLDNGTQENLQAWKNYLRWDELMAELDSDEPNLRTLEEIYLQFRGSYAGLDKPQTTRVRKAMRSYINKAYFAQIENYQEQFDIQLTTLSEAVGRYLEEPIPDDAQTIGTILGWLEQGDQVSRLVERIRQRLDRPNLYASVSREFISAGVRQGVSQVSPVHECILGTNVRGTAHLVGDLDVNLVPSQQNGLIQLTMRGNMTSDNVGVNGPATIYSTGFSDVHVSELLVLDKNGLATTTADANVSTSTVFNAICANLRLVQRIATKRAYQQKGQAEAIASQRAEARIERRFEAETAERIAEANQRLRQEVYRPLTGRDEFPEVINFSTTNNDLYVRMLQVNQSQLAAPGLPPRSAALGRGDLDVHMHESLVNNYGEAFLGGLVLTDEKLVELLEEQGAEVPEELQITPDTDPWSITFDYIRPIQVTFSPGTVNIGIRGRQFTRGDSEVNRTIQISASYAVEEGEQGARLIRQGDVVVDFPTQQRLGPLDLTAKTFLRNKFEAVFKEEIIGEGIQLEGEWADAGTLRLSSLEITPGWFLGTWTMDRPAPAAPISMTSVEK